MVGGHVLDLASIMLMVTARMVGGPAYLEAIEGMDGELTKVIEEFVHAVDVEALRFAKRIGRHLFLRSGDSSS